MKKPLFLAILLVFASHYSYGQKIFSKGYIILTRGDTLRGFVEDAPNFFRIRSIAFKSTQPEQESVYPLEQFTILYLEESREMFASAAVLIDKKPVADRLLESNNKPAHVTEHVLLKYIVNANVSLLQYVDENNKHHFFYNKDNTFTSLSYIRYLANGAHVMEVPLFQNQLDLLFSDCAKMKGRKYKYEVGILKKYFNTYSSCMGQTTSFEEEKRRSKVSPVLILGGAMNFLYFVGADNFNGAVRSFPFENTTGSVVPGFGLYFKSAKQSNPWMETMEFTFKNTGEFYASNNKQNPNVFAPLKEFYITLQHINVNLNVRRNFSLSRSVQPYGQIGIGYRYLLKSTTFEKETTDKGSSNHSPLLKLQKSGLGFAAAVGVSVDRYSAQIGYDFSRFNAATTRTNLNVSSITLALAAKITR